MQTDRLSNPASRTRGRPNRDGSRRTIARSSALAARSGRVGDAAVPLHETELSRAYASAAVSLVERLVSMETRVSVDALHARTRCTAEVAFARQLAMYLAHTIFQLAQADVGERFGRDRTTVKHACARIEDRRDDPAFERRLIAMERLLEEARRAMQLFAVQSATITERVLIEIGARPNRVEDRR